MKLKINLLISAMILLSFMACRNDDDGLTAIPERDREEQQAEDKDTLLEYFATHYYNSEDFPDMEGDIINPTASLDDLVITKLEDGETVPAGHTLLSEAVETHETVFEDVNYEYYILRLNQGGDGEDDNKPHFSDNVRLNFSGNLLDGDVFDSSVNPIVLDLTGLVPGWSRVIPQFNISESFVDNGDGTVDFYNSGVGVMFLPSGLGFWSTGATGVPVYSNLIFEFEIYQFQVNDHDGDGIPSYREDLDNNTELAGDDTDGNVLANFLDPDDDGDGVLTIDELDHNDLPPFNPGLGDPEPTLGVDEFEISRTDPDEDGLVIISTVTIVDANGDGLGDYLDDSIDTNNNTDN